MGGKEKCWRGGDGGVGGGGGGGGGGHPSRSFDSSSLPPPEREHLPFLHLIYESNIIMQYHRLQPQRILKHLPSNADEPELSRSSSSMNRTFLQWQWQIKLSFWCLWFNQVRNGHCADAGGIGIVTLEPKLQMEVIWMFLLLNGFMYIDAWFRGLGGVAFLLLLVPEVAASLLGTLWINLLP